jgi:N-acetylmuramoyl-L-alanine amidase
LTRPNGGDTVPVDTVPVGDAVPKETSSIENIRFWEQDQSIRIAVDLDGDVKFDSGEAKSPDRYFIDIRPARLNSLLLGREWVVNSKLIQRIRVAQYDASTVRIVLDGATLKNVTTSNLKDPSRIVMDVAPPTDAPAPTVITRTTPPPAPSSAAAAPTPALLSANTQPPTAFSEPPRTTSTAPATASAASRAEARVSPAKPATTGDRSLIRSLGLKLSRVVIDAGHGGYDVGSIGPTGFTEKDLVLDVAKRLKALIEAEMGAEVVMTRDSDEFVPLESRTEIANSEKADLFISIHANSSTAKSVRGVETFFLNLNTQSRDALATAARENAASEKKIHELQDILQKIVLNAKTDESRELAEHIQLAMSKRRYAGTNRGVKQAPFVVLIGATMPSVLAEVSFITNPDEERRLKTSEYRQQIAEALFKGIKSYSETLSSTKTAN